MDIKWPACNQNKRAHELLLETGGYASLCGFGQPVERRELFDPMLESLAVLRAWARYRQLPDAFQESRTKEELQAAVSADMSRNWDTPSFAAFTGFDETQVSEMFLIGWLTFNHMVPADRTAASDPQQWVELAGKLRRGRLEAAARPLNSRSAAGDTKVLKSLVARMHAASVARNTHMAALGNYNDKVLESMTFKEFAKFRKDWTSEPQASPPPPKQTQEKKEEKKSRLPPLVQLDSDLLQIVALLVGAALTNSIVARGYVPSVETNKERLKLSQEWPAKDKGIGGYVVWLGENARSMAIGGARGVPLFLAGMAAKQTVDRIFKKDSGIRVWDAMRPQLIPYGRIMSSVAAMVVGDTRHSKIAQRVLGDLVFIAAGNGKSSNTKKIFTRYVRNVMVPAALAQSYPRDFNKIVHQ